MSNFFLINSSEYFPQRPNAAKQQISGSDWKKEAETVDTIKQVLIIDLLAHNWTESEILRNYPGLTHEDIQACLRYASYLFRTERVYMLRFLRKWTDALADK